MISVDESKHVKANRWGKYSYGPMRTPLIPLAVPMIGDDLLGAWSSFLLGAG